MYLDQVSAMDCMVDILQSNSSEFMPEPMLIGTKAVHVRGLRGIDWP